MLVVHSPTRLSVAPLDIALFSTVGMKEANHFHTFVCFVMHELDEGKIYSNFANAMA